MNEQHSHPEFPRWMIYGANGYTGEMIAREAVRRGFRPVLAGRRQETVDFLARNLGLEAHAFALDNPAELLRQLEGCALVLNCAGPFSATAAPLMEACLQTRTHYLDITGEIDVFEAAQLLNTRARDAGVVLCPGVGFDVIPTDCVAAALK
ncbi:saccharopine dehydrogenase NADP-binding domain-containing protein [Citrobacter koseri]|uniref:saccharopine dehydrogenase NADP-binding domain-containing protein n=2 Tax=Enterobacteriaceae TaxID=543 RepID=UPI0019076C90|nr:saccharopine dehydrogenase NADP-binding domain-containing protein [Citrobacter koseri]MBJ8672829.1 saccharopine dehydrogenase NADP-binding domain-containing protein [Citrobacter koseri]